MDKNELNPNNDINKFKAKNADKNERERERESIKDMSIESSREISATKENLYAPRVYETAIIETPIYTKVVFESKPRTLFCSPKVFEDFEEAREIYEEGKKRRKEREGREAKIKNWFKKLL